MVMSRLRDLTCQYPARHGRASALVKLKTTTPSPATSANQVSSIRGGHSVFTRNFTPNKSLHCDGLLPSLYFSKAPKSGVITGYNS
jgi:hypothetical protein